MPTEFVLGPCLESVVEPEPGAVTVAVKGRRQIAFRDPATEPGGKVNLRFLPGAEGDVAPLNVYAFFVADPGSVPPAGPERIPDWFFRSGSPSHSVATDHAPDTFDVVVPGVNPGIHFVATVMEFAV